MTQRRRARLTKTNWYSTSKRPVEIALPLNQAQDDFSRWRRMASTSILALANVILVGVESFFAYAKCMQLSDALVSRLLHLTSTLSSDVAPSCFLSWSNFSRHFKRSHRYQKCPRQRTPYRAKPPRSLWLRPCPAGSAFFYFCECVEEYLRTCILQDFYQERVSSLEALQDILPADYEYPRRQRAAMSMLSLTVLSRAKNLRLWATSIVLLIVCRIVPIKTRSWTLSSCSSLRRSIFLANWPLAHALIV